MESIKNVLDEEILSDNLTFISLFIALYENMTDYVTSSIESLLSDEYFEEGKFCLRHGDEYKNEILNKTYKGKRVNNVKIASFLWLKNNEIITDEEYQLFNKLRKVRNEFSHKMIDYIINGIETYKFELFFKMMHLYQKISQWFFIEVDASIMGYEINDDVDVDGIEVVSSLLFKIMIDVLYNSKSKEYLDIFNNMKK